MKLSTIIIAVFKFRYIKETLSSLLMIFSFLDSSAVLTADFTVNNSTICIGQSVTFTNASSGGTITTYSWNFGAGASPATASTAGPHTVTYSSGGAKTISLTVTGPSGSSTKTKTGFVTVGFDRIKIMSYNLLNYPNGASDTTARNPYFRTTLSSVDPDIFVAEEMTSSFGMNSFLSNVLNASSNTYSAGVYINGFDSDNGIFYKTSKFTFISNHPIDTELRDISEFTLVHILTGDTIRIYAVHLKANPGSPDDAQRGREVDSLRKVTNALLPGSDFIVCGDFNIYNSSEVAYQKLLAVTAGVEGHFYDPLPLSGTWNNSSFAIYHTQSPRDTALGDGGSTGGLDDRFDMMLFSKGINTAGGMSYVSGSTTAYGNDGNHYNKSVIESPTNTAVPANVANALYYGSDHLPVFASFDLQLNNCNPLDVGATALVTPVSPICPGPGKQVTVRIANFSSYAADFSQSSLTLNVQITKPNATVLSYSKTLNSGILAASGTMDITLDSLIDMSSSGNYTFNANTIFSPDINSSNNPMSPATVNAGAAGSTTITPSGPTIFCSGGSVTLSAGAGSNYQWSNGATTQSIVVTAAGDYSVSFITTGGCFVTSNTVTVTLTTFYETYTVFTEDMGSVATTTAIAAHESANGFQNDVFTMSGTGDVRNTQTSLGAYTGASGGANIFLTSTAGRYFQIDGINTSQMNDLKLSFAVFKTSSSSNGNDLLLQFASDGVFDSTLSFTLATGANWQYVTATGTLPSATNLQLKFLQTGTASMYRIDDMMMTYTADTPRVTALGPTTFCSGGSVVLTTAASNSYLWSTGATTQSITVSTSGNYSVQKTAANGCTASSSPVTVSANACSTQINLKLFIEGYYLGASMMKAVSDPAGHPLDCDTVKLQLASSVSPYAIQYTATSILHTDGNVQFTFPPAVTGNSYYLIVRHRNGLETWSSSPVTISSSNFTYMFSDNQTKAFGSRMKNLGDGNFAIYSGDVNQNGVIDMTDYDSIDNSSFLFTSGYLPGDLTGDYIIDQSDQSLVENNFSVTRSRP